MDFLIIDTSSPHSFVALCKNGDLIIDHLPSMKQSLTLLPAIEKLLGNGSIDFIAIGTGPGSFTGTRVGVMAAKALAFSKKIPLLPFCSLKIYTPENEGPFTLCTDAKSLGFYKLDGEKSKNGTSYGSPYLSTGGAVSTTLNLSHLALFLQEKFSQSAPLCHGEIKISYLLDLEQ